MKNSILWVIFFVLSGCCTKRLCLCPELKIDIYATKDIGFYSLVRLDKSMAKIDSIFMNFSSGTPVYSLNKDSFAFKQDESIEDFNYVIKNSRVNECDTIRDITYNLKSYSFECNDCFLKKDIMYCSDIIDEKLTYNGDIIGEFKITLN